MDEVDEVLHGGVANAGAVLRRGAHVLRPGNPHSRSILDLLGGLHGAGFDGAPLPVAVDPDGRERLVFIPGDVAIPPYPDWVQSDDALASVAILLRGLHDATTKVDTTNSSWAADMADPAGPGTGADATVVCHNDVCLENVVFREGRAVALLDFDFAAPGRRTYDVAAFARMCVPVDDDLSAARLGWHPADRTGRLRLVCDAYGLDSQGRHEVLTCLDASIARGGEWVLARVEKGDPGFVQMWADIGGMERFDRRRRWWSTMRAEFASAM